MNNIMWGNLGQWISCVLLGAGLTLIILSPLDIGRTLITVGSVVFSAATKLKLIGYEIAANVRRGKKK